MNSTNKNYDELAKAIVIQAVEDYKRALKEQKELENKLMLVNSRITECEKFFESEWCKELSNIEDSTYIIDNARKTAKEELKNEVVIVSIRIKQKKDEVEE